MTSPSSILPSSILDDRRRRALLVELRGLGSDADAHQELIRVFLPLPSHAAALAPTKLIVRGERGAGKTALFHLLRELDERGLGLAAMFPDGLDTPSRWIEGFTERGKAHPSTAVLDQLGAEDPDDARLRAFWFGHLVGVLAESSPGEEQPPGPFMASWRARRTEPAAWVEAARDELGPLTSWLDRFDDRAARTGEWVFVSYDHLDKIGITQPAVRVRFASTLLAMWLSLTNRYERLRGKVFLREDLFQASVRGSTDASKLETRSVSLYWSTEDLYRVLIRHIAAADGLREWLSTGRNSIALRADEPLGWFPPEALPEDGRCSQRTFAEKLAGEIMGAGVKKGYTHRWIPNHLQDAHGLIVPRPMLNILAFAAQWALEKGPRAQYSRLLHPTELQAALEKTSRYRANEVAEEQPVVRRLERLRDVVLLADRRTIVDRLRDPVPAAEDGFGADGDAAFEELVRLGVLETRPDGRVDVPDIYRFGFGIKRKGGVARPR